VLGSLKYAIEHLRGSLKIVVVLGHSGCGAVTAAVDVFLDSARYLPLATNHSLRTIIDQLLVVVQASAARMAEILGPEIKQSPGYRAALIEISVLLNAALAAYTVQQGLSGSEQDEIRAMYGVYILETHQVWAPPRNRAAWNGLADPPRNIADFVELGKAVIGSERIAALLSLA
jgi:carbonic anhydrase